MRTALFTSVLILISSLAYADSPEMPATQSTDGYNLSTTSSAHVNTDSLTIERSDLVEYITRHFSGYEPVYFLVGSRPTAKFQLSFKYLLFEEDHDAPLWLNPVHHIFFTYSQTSFWDLAGNSKPFTDNSYRPGLMLSYSDVLRNHDLEPLSRLDIQGGYQHESNGLAGANSRSINSLFLRPIFTFGDDTNPTCPFISVAPTAFVYILSLSDNPDIKDYRGHVDLRVVAGYFDGLQLATIARLGNDGNKGSLQFDFSYPLRHLLHSFPHVPHADCYLHAQVFTGVGETLIRYRDSTTTFRAGISLVR